MELVDKERCHALTLILDEIEITDPSRKKELALTLESIQFRSEGEDDAQGSSKTLGSKALQ